MGERPGGGTVVVEPTATPHVRVVRIARPEARNALDVATRQALVTTLRQAVADGDRALVLTGTAASFAAGADLREMAARTADEQKAFISVPRMYEVIEALPVPVIAAINGHALGAGLELALACDVRIAATTAKLGSPEIRLGLIPGGGATQRLPRLIGLGQALRLILTGEPVGADEALRLGLVEEVVPQDQLIQRSVDLGAMMARWSPVALAAAKRAVRASWHAHLAQGLAAEIELFAQAFGSEDAREGLAAFLEKREPRFKGE